MSRDAAFSRSVRQRLADPVPSLEHPGDGPLDARATALRPYVPPVGGYEIDRDAGWQARLTDRTAQYLAESPTLRPLMNRLLGTGGRFVIMPGIEEDLDKLLARGQTWTGPARYRIRGHSSACHANAAALWHMRPDRYQIATGYALSADGLWRQHSWCMDALARPREARPCLVETTEPRLLYHGFILTVEEAEDFADLNV